MSILLITLSQTTKKNVNNRLLSEYYFLQRLDQAIVALQITICHRLPKHLKLKT